MILIVLTFVDLFGVISLSVSGSNSTKWADFQNALSAATVVDVPHLKDEHASKFLEKEFDKACQEIQMRLEHEHTLYFYQFVLIGGIFVVALGSAGLFSPVAPRKDNNSHQRNAEATTVTRLLESGGLNLMLGLAATGLIMVDIHIQYNSHIIVQLGNWIYSAYEKGAVFGWEAYLRDGIPWFHSSIPNKLATDATFIPSIAMLLAFYVSLVLQVAPINVRLALLQKTVFIFVQGLCLSFFVLNNLLLSNDQSWQRWSWLIIYLVLWGYITFSSKTLWGQFHRLTEIPANEE